MTPVRAGGDNPASKAVGTARQKAVTIQGSMTDRFRAGVAIHPALRKLLFPVKAVTFVWRFVGLWLWTAYLEGNREPQD